MREGDTPEGASPKGLRVGLGGSVQPAIQVDPGSNPTRGIRLKSGP